MARVYDMSQEIGKRLYDEMLDRMIAECPIISERDTEGIEIEEVGELKGWQEKR